MEVRTSTLEYTQVFLICTERGYIEGASQNKGIEKRGKKAIEWRMDKKSWEVKAEEAFKHYIADLKATLPANANFRDIEQAMLKFSPELLRKTAEALANAEDFSPTE